MSLPFTSRRRTVYRRPTAWTRRSNHAPLPRAVPPDPVPAPAPVPPADPATGSPAAPVTARRTHLELAPDRPLLAAPFPKGPEARVVPRPGCDVAEYRALYAGVGGPWRWRDRLAWPDAALAVWLARPDVAVHVLEVRSAGAWAVAGYHELVRRAPDEVELLYFGLLPAFHGRGLGGAFLTHAVRTARAMGDDPARTRVILNTCTFDGPAALPNYLARGFRVVREEAYVVDGGA